MRSVHLRAVTTAFAVAALTCTTVASANSYREKGKSAAISNSALTVVPPRDWNKLGAAPGKNTETWTLDGEELNDITFFAGIEPGKPLIKETDKKRRPLPRFTPQTLLVEVPELVEATYRIGKNVADFTITRSAPEKFLGRDGIAFDFAFVGDDALPRRGEARATLVNGKLYMVVFAAPRLNYYDRTLADFHGLAASARLN